ncbi:MAG TPA: Rrf2 family transcriptional regulator [Clostridiales bacterium]|nr:Rrf2 family transcriptional regulator [Clostridiales bacterium]
MKLSTKGIYGVMAVLDLTLHQSEGYISLRSVAERHQLSESYMEQLFSTLRKKGILSGARGSQGGYALKKNPKDITVGMVLEALEGSLKPVDCTAGKKSCDRYELCVTRVVWERIEGAIRDVTDRITFEDLANEFNKQGSQEQYMYYI